MKWSNRGLFGRMKNRAPKTDQVFKTNRWSQYQWSRFLEESKKTETMVKDGSVKLRSFPQFAHETFTRLYEPGTKRLDKTRPEDHWAVRAHEEIEQMPEWQQLGRKCQADRLLAGEAAHVFTEHILEGLPEPPEEMENESPEDLRDQVKGLQKFIESMKADGQDTTKAEQAVQKLQQQGKAAVQAALEYAKGMDASQLRGVIREALEAAHEAVDGEIEMVDGLCNWGNGLGTPSFISADAKAALAEKVKSSYKLQQLAKEAGRMRRMAAMKQRTKAAQTRSEVSDIELGNDLQRTLPSELVKLTHPLLKLDFYRKFLEHGLLQYRLKGLEKQGQGPIVICIDQSGSMNGPPEIWSKAVALALLQIAAMQNRPARVIHFEGSVRRVDDWPAGNVDPLELLKSMEKFYSGNSTNFEQPLEKSLEAITRDPTLKRADVVFITDGLSHVSSDFLRHWHSVKKELTFTCYGVYIGGRRDNPGTLASFTDVYLPLADIRDDAETTEVIFGI